MYSCIFASNKIKTFVKSKYSEKEEKRIRNVEYFERRLAENNCKRKKEINRMKLLICSFFFLSHN